MSFNTNHNSVITTENYEEYFLLYIDNELNKEERAAVDQFLQSHPDLQNEMNMLMGTRLSTEEINLNNKELLFSENMRLNSIQESLLLYIDDELNIDEKKWLADKIIKEPAVQDQYALLLKTKLDSSEQILYPDKRELYRYEKRRIIPAFWMRVAAILVISLGIGGFVYNYQHRLTDEVATAPPVGEEKKSTDQKTEVEVTAEVSPKNSKPTPIAVGPLSTDDVNNETRGLAKQKPRKEVIKKTIAPEIKEKFLLAPEDEKEPEQNSVAISEPSKRIINNPPVTPETPASYNDVEASPEPAVTRDVLAKADNKKSSLKGFLRKATRYIERRTNISATNEDGELLIGAVAFKL